VKITHVLAIVLFFNSFLFSQGSKGPVLVNKDIISVAAEVFKDSDGAALDKIARDIVIEQVAAEAQAYLDQGIHFLVQPFEVLGQKKIMVLSLRWFFNYRFWTERQKYLQDQIASVNESLEVMKNLNDNFGNDKFKNCSELLLLIQQCQDHLCLIIKNIGIAKNNACLITLSEQDSFLGDFTALNFEDEESEIVWQANMRKYFQRDAKAWDQEILAVEQCYLLYDSYIYPEIENISALDKTFESAGQAWHFAGLPNALAKYELQKITHHQKTAELLEKLTRYEMAIVQWEYLAKYWESQGNLEKQKVALDRITAANEMLKYRKVKTFFRRTGKTLAVLAPLAAAAMFYKRYSSERLGIIPACLGIIASGCIFQHVL